jgi:penicillin-binding protein 2
MFKKKRHISTEIAPEDIFLDSENLPDFDAHQFEGRIEKPISKKTIFYTGLFFFLIGISFMGRAWILQIKNGEAYAKRSEDNRLLHTVIFADRGIIKDRNGINLAWNIPPHAEGDFARRQYIEKPGMNNLLGFIKYPSKDKNGNFYKEDISGHDGVEEFFNAELSGKNGLKMVETDALGEIESQSAIQKPEHGAELVLSIDSRINSVMQEKIRASSALSGFQGGAGVMMDIETGEVIAMTTFPEYNSQVLSEGSDRKTINQYINDPNNSFLDRTISGLYTPGSIMKPFIALGVLNDNVITPEKKILSTGSISIPNPYFPDKKTVFRDWRANGWTDVREAIAVSSDVYFYAVGGGYQDQRGLGILNIDRYVSMFGFGKHINSPFFAGKSGVIPSPEWKKKNFNGDAWRVGDTYNTSIGQFGFQVTPIQAVRAVAAIANGGTLINPVIKKGEKGDMEKINGISPEYFQIVREGMRMAVTEGTMTSLNFSNVKVAGKTGTAELGASKKYINSWAIGFFPYDKPKYAFALVLEKGPAEYKEGAQAVMRNLLIEMASSTPEYLK